MLFFIAQLVACDIPTLPVIKFKFQGVSITTLKQSKQSNLFHFTTTDRYALVQRQDRTILLPAQPYIYQTCVSPLGQYITYMNSGFPAKWNVYQYDQGNDSYSIIFETAGWLFDCQFYNQTYFFMGSITNINAFTINSGGIQFSFLQGTVFNDFQYDISIDKRLYTGYPNVVIYSEFKARKDIFIFKWDNNGKSMEFVSKQLVSTSYITRIRGEYFFKLGNSLLHIYRYDLLKQTYNLVIIQLTNLPNLALDQVTSKFVIYNNNQAVFFSLSQNSSLYQFKLQLQPTSFVSIAIIDDQYIISALDTIWILRQSCQKVWDGKDIVCGECSTRQSYDKKFGTCIQCQSSCMACSSAKVCAVCDQNYFLVSGYCSPCTNCQQCANSYFCMSCGPEEVLVLGRCYPVCPDFFKFQAQTQSCVLCKQNCFNCSIKDYCVVCFDGFQQLQGSCIEVQTKQVQQNNVSIPLQQTTKALSTYLTVAKLSGMFSLVINLLINLNLLQCYEAHLRNLSTDMNLVFDEINEFLQNVYLQNLSKVIETNFNFSSPFANELAKDSVSRILEIGVGLGVVVGYVALFILLKYIFLLNPSWRRKRVSSLAIKKLIEIIPAYMSTTALLLGKFISHNKFQSLSFLILKTYVMILVPLLVVMCFQVLSHEIWLQKLQKLFKSKKTFCLTSLILFKQLFIPLNITLAPSIQLQSALNIMFWFFIVFFSRRILFFEMFIAGLFFALDIVLLIPTSTNPYSLRQLLNLCLVVTIIYIAMMQAFLDLVKSIITGSLNLFLWLKNLGRNSKSKKKKIDIRSFASRKKFLYFDYRNSKMNSKK